MCAPQPALMVRLPLLRRGSLVDKLVRCMSVSVLTTVISMTVLLTLTIGLGFPAWLANIAACAVGTGPSYFLNRRWVWRKSTVSDPWREVLPFWVLSFSGLVLSTVVVSVADSWALTANASSLARSVVLVTSEIAAYGLLWIGQFLILDRVLFSAGDDAGPGAGSTANLKQTLSPAEPGAFTMRTDDAVLVGPTRRSKHEPHGHDHTPEHATAEWRPRPDWA